MRSRTHALRLQDVFLSGWGLLPIGVYLILGFWWAYRLRYHINGDAAAYLDVARLWADRPGLDAVVGYWGPLISWLTLPAYLLLGDLIVAGKVTAFAIGGVWVVSLQWFLANRCGPKRAAIFTLACAVPGLLFIGVPFLVLPDALLSLVVIALLSVLSRYADSERAWLAGAGGAICGAAFLVKTPSWALFVPATLLLVAWLGMRRRIPGLPRALSHAVLVIAGFLLVAGPWIGAVSIRSGHLSMGTSRQTLLRNWIASSDPDAPSLRFAVPYRGERWLHNNPWAYEPIRPVPLTMDIFTTRLSDRFVEAGWFLLYFPAALVGAIVLVLRIRRAWRSRTRLVPMILVGWPLLVLVSMRLERRYLLYVLPQLLLLSCCSPSPFRWGSSRMGRSLQVAGIAAIGIAGIMWKCPRIPFGKARAEVAAKVLRSSRKGGTFWSNVLSDRVPFAFLIDSPIAVHDPVRDEGLPPSDLLLLRLDSEGGPPVPPGHVTWLEWKEETGYRYKLLARGP